MPDPEKVWNLRFMAEEYLDSLVKMDLEIEKSDNYSILRGLENQDLDAISFVWLENFMKDKNMKLELLNHLKKYSDGYLKRSLELVVRKWVSIKGIDVDKALKDFCLIE